MNRPRGLLPLVVAALALSGCAAFSEEPATTTGDDGEPGAPAVLTSFYPLQYLAEEIGGERVSVSSLTPPNVDPHTVELAPRTVAEMDHATLVVYLSGFQPAVDEAVAISAAPAFDARDHTQLLTTAQTGHDHSHDDDHAGDDHDAHDADDAPHDHAGEPTDPHFWLDPVRLAEVGLALAEELAAVDAEGAGDYRANAEELAAELRALDEELTAGLAECERDTIVVAHEAYGYLTAPHGLHQEGLSGIDPDTEPSPARLAQVADVVAEHDVDTVFVESLLNPAVTEALAGDLGLRTAVLDPLENQQDPAADYLDVMRANLTALQDALACTAA